MNDSKRIVILSLFFGDEWQEIGNLTSENKQKYADRWGYDYKVGRELYDESRPPPWSKILMIQDFLADYDWIFWSDADAAILNFDVRLETFVDEDFDVVISEDLNGINTGSFFLRNSEWSFWFLQKVYQYGEYTHHPWWDNAVFHYLYHGVVDMTEGSKNFAHRFNCQNSDIQCHFKVVDQRKFNSYYESYVDGDFIIHLPGLSNERRLEILRELLQVQSS